MDESPAAAAAAIVFWKLAPLAVKIPKVCPHLIGCSAVQLTAFCPAPSVLHSKMLSIWATHGANFDWFIRDWMNICVYMTFLDAYDDF